MQTFIKQDRKVRCEDAAVGCKTNASPSGEVNPVTGDCRGISRAIERIARKFLAIYLTLPNYTNNFLRLGFQQSDITTGGSDRLIDAIVAWGDLKTVVKRIREHHSAGADHVCIQVLTADPKTFPIREHRELASAVFSK